MIKTELKNKKLDSYRDIIGLPEISKIRRAAEPLLGSKIYEINATSVGGGVAELLRTHIPLMRDLGIDANWLVLPPDDEFFGITKSLHNCLQGNCTDPVVHMMEYYQHYSEKIAADMPRDGSLYVLHDPQTVGLTKYLEGKPMIWRCHIDLTESDKATLDWLKYYYRYFDRVVFSMDEYINGLDRHKATIIRPAIDPLSEKNLPLDSAEIKSLCTSHGVDYTRPFMLQVSRFDKFKDPIGVIELYSRVQQLIPEMQLVLMGNYATDDPEGQPYFLEVKRAADQAKGDITIITQNSDRLVNALQRAAAVVIQNSTREGFGLTVTEALYKGAIVFTRPVGGIALQVLNNKTGFYLDDNHDLSAHRLVEVVRNPDKYAQVRQAAVAHVKKNFLITTMLLDHLELYSKVLAQEKSPILV